MKVVIIDDDKLVSMSLKTILESATGITVEAVGNDGTEALGLYEKHRPDVLLMDIRMEHMTGVEAARKVIAEYPDAKILFLTTFSDDEYIIEALEIGVRGYILKQDFEGLIPALEAVQQGQTVFGGKIVGKLPGLLQESLSFDYEAKGITQKEYDIIQLVAQGLSNKEIAAKTFLSEGTIRNYLSTVLEKLDLRDRTQLAVFYYQNGGR
ncbi:MAG: response regulator transcription factor [Lachnospira sp.]|nr:response regulator transcription factor [Lachnospira sp.]